jgi:hypothetical protein
VITAYSATVYIFEIKDIDEEPIEVGYFDA